MATTHPYITSSGPIVSIVAHLRRSFPAVVDAATLRRLGIAPKNESYLVNILRFLGIIDAEGKRTDTASKIFAITEDAKFRKEFSALVKAAYKSLFDDHGEAAWKLDTNTLTTFFRQIDESGGIVGARQANTFRTLSALSGHADIPQPRPSAPGTRPVRPKRGDKRVKNSKQPGPASERSGSPAEPSVGSGFGLTVRIEVNLPAEGDQDTYDKIFQSIRKNLIDGK
jgi:hypothetical protein